MGDEVSIVVNEGNDGSTSTGKHSWVVEIDKLSKTEHSPQTDPLINKNCTIYRRPVNVQEEQDSNFLYRPRIVSFGPYHHDDESCQQTNKIKKLALLHCLKSSSKGIHDYVDALRADVKNLKEAYNKLEPKWEQDDDAFLQLMVFDGCFLLHILREGNHLDHLSHELLAVYKISANELIEYYKHDMLLLENQLPMQLLEKLLVVRNDSSIEEAQEDLYKLILRFIVPSSPNIAENLPRQNGQHVYLHVLDLYRHSLLLYHDQHEGKSGSQTPVEARRPIVIMIKRTLASNKYVWIGNFLFFPIFVFAGSLLALPLLFIFLIICWSLFAIRSTIFIMYMIEPARDVWFIIPSVTELQKAAIAPRMMRTKSPKSIAFGDCFKPGTMFAAYNCVKLSARCYIRKK
ncbi:hypothetical protein CDL12_09745 [Handroanthus impetiginosus]|uniref:Uncharacterized protein n=1 Tax=Handroanthus impetiginosus TaxID=429701 RepID=A0A2G9HJ81_9LAMI|nr:hypothetical protein CDL12_09745 [Handroanthus impetiginosus]